MTYDVQGNLDTWNALEYFFDYGNRLRGIYAGTGAVIETYRYDGLGRRVQSRSPTGQTVRSQYARDGKLVFQYDQLTSERVAYLYLGNRLVATRTRPLSAPVYTIEYQHTDPLGSPVAKSDTNGVVQRRDDYEPYGKRINRANDNRPGFTGHVVDVATGLTYMQQRYYDPRIGRFWSVDPVTAFSSPGSNFNRYAYANNNPYKFTDPDGRYSCVAGKKECAAVAKATRSIKKSFQSSQSRSLRGRALIGAVRRHLGSEGDDNGVVISATDGNSTSETWSGGANHIKINFGSAEAKGFEERVASTLVHEATHGFDQKMRGRAGFEPMTTSRTELTIQELRANITQAVFYRGQSRNAPRGQWTQQGGIDWDVINFEANRSVKSACNDDPCTP